MHCGAASAETQGRRVQALPQFYAQNDGCKVPQQAYGSHGAPRPDKSIEFEIWQNQRTNPVNKWEPRGVYNISVRVWRCLVRRRVACLCTEVCRRRSCVVAAAQWAMRSHASHGCLNSSHHAAKCSADTCTMQTIRLMPLRSASPCHCLFFKMAGSAAER